MERVADLAFKLLELLLVILLAGMALMVFGNVALRYLFNSGITVSEELSRYFFVWLTFIGAVVTFREGAHLGVETLVRRFGRPGRLICMAASDLLILGCCAVFFIGTWQQAGINYTNISPVTGLNMLFVYGIGFFTGGAIGLMVALRLLRIAFGQVTEAEIAAFAGELTEEAAAIRSRTE